MDLWRRSFARGISSNTLILLVVVWLTGAANLSFFGNVLKTYGVSTATLPALASLLLAFAALSVLLVAPLAIGRATRPVLIALLLVSAPCAYFMDSYGVVINDEMMQNVAQTQTAEVRDLLNLRLLGYFLALGVVPAWFVGRIQLVRRHWRDETLARMKLIALAIGVLVAAVAPFGSFYASFLREHKALRAYANPAYPLYAAVKYARRQAAATADRTLQPVGRDGHIPPTDPHRELVVLVVGETARADHFSLNGYERETNPWLKQEPELVSFTDFHSCGTSTAVSVPCMFSLDGSNGSAEGRENLLDLLQRAGVQVLWLDNNSDSKGVALRVAYQDFKSAAVNPVCDVECRDEGMLVPLQGWIDRHASGDILIVLHQMGNHGPAYYRRYPPAFERFRPACQSNDLSQCSREEIINAYDNALLYTDHFLAQTIELLKRNGDRFETALFYVSDHGESLGEGGTWLHGLPRAIAPQAQLHVPALMWFGGRNHDVDIVALRQKRNQPFSHDNLFHTVLGFFEIATSVYRPELDILTGVHKDD